MNTTNPIPVPVSPPSAPESMKLPSGGDILKKIQPNNDQFAEQIREIQEWDQPLNSSLALASVVGVYYLTAGNAGYSIVSLLCCSVVVRLVSVAALRRSIAKLSGNEKTKSIVSFLERLVLLSEEWFVIPSPQQIKSLTQTGAKLMEALLVFVCTKLARATDPTPEGALILKKVLGAISILLLGLQFLSLQTALFLIAVHQLTWPAIYNKYQTKIDAAFNKASGALAPYTDKAKGKIDELYVVAEAKISAILQVLQQKVQDVSAQMVQKYQDKFLKQPAEKTE